MTCIFPEGVIKPSVPSSTPLTEIFPDLKGDKLVVFNLIEYSITSSLSLNFHLNNLILLLRLPNTFPSN